MKAEWSAPKTFVRNWPASDIDQYLGRLSTSEVYELLLQLQEFLNARKHHADLPFNRLISDLSSIMMDAVGSGDVIKPEEKEARLRQFSNLLSDVKDKWASIQVESALHSDRMMALSRYVNAEVIARMQEIIKPSATSAKHALDLRGRFEFLNESNTLQLSLRRKAMPHDHYREAPKPNYEQTAIKWLDRYAPRHRDALIDKLKSTLHDRPEIKTRWFTTIELFMQHATTAEEKESVVVNCIEMMHALRAPEQFGLCQKVLQISENLLSKHSNKFTLKQFEEMTRLLTQHCPAILRVEKVIHAFLNLPSYESFHCLTALLSSLSTEQIVTLNAASPTLLMTLWNRKLADKEMKKTQKYTAFTEQLQWLSQWMNDPAFISVQALFKPELSAEVIGSALDLGRFASRINKALYEKNMPVILSDYLILFSAHGPEALQQDIALCQPLIAQLMRSAIEPHTVRGYMREMQSMQPTKAAVLLAFIDKAESTSSRHTLALWRDEETMCSTLCRLSQHKPLVYQALLALWNQHKPSWQQDNSAGLSMLIKHHEYVDVLKEILDPRVEPFGVLWDNPNRLRMLKELPIDKQQALKQTVYVHQELFKANPAFLEYLMTCLKGGLQAQQCERVAELFAFYKRTAQSIDSFKHIWSQQTLVAFLNIPDAQQDQWRQIIQTHFHDFLTLPSSTLQTLFSVDPNMVALRAKTLATPNYPEKLGQIIRQMGPESSIYALSTLPFFWPHPEAPDYQHRINGIILFNQMRMDAIRRGTKMTTDQVLKKLKPLFDFRNTDPHLAIARGTWINCLNTKSLVLPRDMWSMADNQELYDKTIQQGYQQPLAFALDEPIKYRDRLVKLSFELKDVRPDATIIIDATFNPLKKSLEALVRQYEGMSFKNAQRRAKTVEFKQLIEGLTAQTYQATLDRLEEFRNQVLREDAKASSDLHKKGHSRLIDTINTMMTTVLKDWGQSIKDGKHPAKEGGSYCHFYETMLANSINELQEAKAEWLRDAQGSFRFFAFAPSASTKQAVQDLSMNKDDLWHLTKSEFNRLPGKIQTFVKEVQHLNSETIAAARSAAPGHS